MAVIWVNCTAEINKDRYFGIGCEEDDGEYEILPCGALLLRGTDEDGAKLDEFVIAPGQWFSVHKVA